MPLCLKTWSLIVNNSLVVYALPLFESSTEIEKGRNSPCTLLVRIHSRPSMLISLEVKSSPLFISAIFSPSKNILALQAFGPLIMYSESNSWLTEESYDKKKYMSYYTLELLIIYVRGNLSFAIISFKEILLNTKSVISAWTLDLNGLT